MKLILTRHGETIENKLGICQGHLPGSLSGEGLAQAKKVALRLKDEKIDIIYSSDLERAAATAREIMRYHPDTPAYFVPQLRERDFGSYSGKKSDELDWKHTPPDVETLEQLRKRAALFLDKLYQSHSQQNVLCVAHAGINKEFIAVIMDKPADYVRELEQQHNTAINIFDIGENGNHKIHLLNCKKHLEE